MNSILIFIFIFTVLIIFRHGYFLVQHSNRDEKYKLTNKELITLGASIAYFLTFIIS